jgi:hypothetical protein
MSTLHGLSPSAMKAHTKTLLCHTARYVTTMPILRNVALALLNRLPGVKLRLSRIIIGGTVPRVAAIQVPADLANLTPRTRRIYADLKSAIEHLKKDNP